MDKGTHSHHALIECEVRGFLESLHRKIAPSTAKRRKGSVDAFSWQGFHAYLNSMQWCILMRLDSTGLTTKPRPT